MDAGQRASEGRKRRQGEVKDHTIRGKAPCTEIATHNKGDRVPLCHLSLLEEK